MREKFSVRNADDSRCLTITPSDRHDSLPPFVITHSTYDGCERSYYYRDYFRLYYAERGYITLTSGKHSARLSYGDIAIIPPDHTHTVALSTSDTELYECSFTIGLVEDILKMQAGTGGTLSRLFNTGELVIIQPVPAEFQIHLQHLMEFILFEAMRPDSEYAIKNCLAALLCEFSNLYRAQENAPEVLEKNSVVYAIHYIKQNYAENITLDGMATLTHASRKDFCRRFKQFTGKTLHEFVNGVRISKALEVLKSTEGDLSFSSLSSISGFEDYTTFYRNFVKIVGISPTEYILERNKKLQ